MESKLDLILKELQRLNDKVEQIENRLDKIEERLDKIEARLDKLEARMDALEKRVDNLENRVNTMEKRLDTRITIVDSNCKESFEKLFDIVNSLNNSFLKFEAELYDKIRILFDADVDRKNHKTIYAQEFITLKKLIEENSFRISNLEKHNKH